MLMPGTNSTSKNADDIVITLAVRTPLTKGFKGGFKDTELDYLIYALLKKVVEKSKIDPQLIEDICCGNVCKKSYDLRKIPLSNLAHRSAMERLHTNSELLHLLLVSRTPRVLRQ